MALFFKAEKELKNGSDVEVEKKVGDLDKISGVEEIKRIILDYSLKKVKKEPIQFKRASSKFEKYAQKFDALITRSANPSLSDLEREFTQIISSPFQEDEKSTILFTSILANCWESKSVSNLEKEQFIEYIKTKDGRKKLGECLNKYRKAGQFSIKEKAFILVCELLYLTIDQIKLQDDLDSAANIMILSQTFYYELQKPDGKKEKIFLQSGIQNHEFWHEKTFWEKAINSSIEKDLNSQEIAEESEEEKKIRIINIVFGKIGTYSHNMLQFGNEKAEVEKLIDAIAEQRQLPKMFIFSLKVH